MLPRSGTPERSLIWSIDHWSETSSEGCLATAPTTLMPLPAETTCALPIDSVRLSERTGTKASTSINDLHLCESADEVAIIGRQQPWLPHDHEGYIGGVQIAFERSASEQILKQHKPTRHLDHVRIRVCPCAGNPGQRLGRGQRLGIV